jgi:hypothetical protein
MVEQNKPKTREEALQRLAELDEELGINSYYPGSDDAVINGYRLICTCGACPEQYDVFTAAGQKVGYLRLRHGCFRADVPACGGETIYESYPKGDGCFAADERESELTKAVEAIQAWWKTHES